MSFAYIQGAASSKVPFKAITLLAKRLKFSSWHQKLRYSFV